MIRIYTAPSCASCRKVKAWLKEHQIPYVEKNIFSTLLRETELKELLERSENGTDDIISKRSKIIKENKVDLDDMSINELIHFIQIEFSRVGALTNITPREIIRDFIELLNTLYQYPEKDLLTIIQSDEFQNHSQPFADQDVSDEFASFEL